MKKAGPVSAAATPQTQKTPSTPAQTSSSANVAKATPSAQPSARPVTTPPPKSGRLEKLATQILMFRRKEGNLDPQKLTALAAEIQAAAKEELPQVPGLLLGILALCAIPGHDVHFLNSTLKIDQHVPVQEVLPERLQEARTTLVARGDFLCAIFVFENTFQYLSKNGEISDNDPMA